jgi:aryl-alcohol dehydrogenase-like predicted oxidoreductase
VDQLEDNLHSVQVILTDEQLKRLDAVSQNQRQNILTG